MWNNNSVTTLLYRHGIDYLKTAETIGDKVIIDVGCFCGDSILAFREKFKRNKIYSFETRTSIYEIAKKTMKSNHIDNVIIENFGLGDKTETALPNSIGSIDKASDSPVRLDPLLLYSLGYRRDNPPRVQIEPIKLDTLDNYVAKYGLKVGLIKVDIEGYEHEFLRGAINTIREQKPILLLSIYHTYHDFFSIKPLIESWGLGYKFDFFKGVDEFSTVDIELLCEVY